MRPAQPRIVKDIRRADLTYLFLALVSALVFFAFHQVYIGIVNPDVLYMDSLRILYKIDSWQDGKLSLFDLWNDHPVHKGLIVQAFLLANMEWFRLDVGLANRLTGVAIFACAAWTSWHFLASMKSCNCPPTTRALVLLSTAIAMPALFYGLAGFEVLTLDMGLPAWTRAFLFLVFFASNDAFLRRPTAKKSFFLSIFAASIVLLVGQGWSYPFVFALIGSHLFFHIGIRSGEKYLHPMRVAPTASALLSLILLTVLGNVFAENSTDPHPRHLTSGMVPLPFYGIGSSVIGGETFTALGIPDVCAMGLGIAIFSIALYGVIARMRRGVVTGPMLPIYMVAYGLFMAATTAVARSGHGIASVMASRYYMDMIFLLIGAIWLTAEEALLGGKEKKTGIIVFSALLACTLTGYSITTVHEWRAAPYRKLAFDRLRAITRGISIDTDSALQLQSPRVDAQDGVDVMVRRRLSVFARMDGKRCENGTDYLLGWYQKEEKSHWMAKQASMVIAPCECPMHLQVYLPESFSKRNLKVVTRIPGAKPMVMNLSPGSVENIELPPTTYNYRVELETSATTLPAKDLQGSADQRVLGVQLGFPEIAPSCKATRQSK